MVPREAKLTEPIVVAPEVSMQEAVQSTIKVRPSIKVATSSIEAAAPLVSMFFALIFCSSCALITNLTFLLQAPHMQEVPRDIDKLLKDVFLTLQQCKTPTKTSSTSISL